MGGSFGESRGDKEFNLPRYILRTLNDLSLSTNEWSSKAMVLDEVIKEVNVGGKEVQISNVGALPV